MIVTGSVRDVNQLIKDIQKWIRTEKEIPTNWWVERRDSLLADGKATADNFPTHVNIYKLRKLLLWMEHENEVYEQNLAVWQKERNALMRMSIK